MWGTFLQLCVARLILFWNWTRNQVKVWRFVSTKKKKKPTCFGDPVSVSVVVGSGPNALLKMSAFWTLVFLSTIYGMIQLSLNSVWNWNGQNYWVWEGNKSQYFFNREILNCYAFNALQLQRKIWQPFTCDKSYVWQPPSVSAKPLLKIFTILAAIHHNPTQMSSYPSFPSASRHSNFLNCQFYGYEVKRQLWSRVYFADLHGEYQKFCWSLILAEQVPRLV